MSIAICSNGRSQFPEKQKKKLRLGLTVFIFYQLCRMNREPQILQENSNPLQYSCLENPMEGGAWQATVHGVAKSRTQLSDFNSLTLEIDLFLQRRHTDGKQTHEKMLNIIHYQKNAN